MNLQSQLRKLAAIHEDSGWFSNAKLLLRAADELENYQSQPDDLTRRLAEETYEALAELTASIKDMDFSYKSSDFLPGDKNRRFQMALHHAEQALAAYAETQRKQEGGK